MKRILVWFWSGGGGGSQFAAHLAYRLTQQFGADAVTLSMRADDPTAATAEARGVRTLRADVVSDRNRPLESLASLARSARIVREHIARARADTVLLAMNFAVAAPLSLALERPLIYCTHDPDPHRGDFAATAQRITQAQLLRRAETVVTLSQFAADRLCRRAFVRDRLRVASLSSVFEPTPIVSPLSQDKVRLLMIGRMIAYKGLGLLQAVLPHIATRGDWHLSIVGQGPALNTRTLAAFARWPQVSVHDIRMTEAEVDALLDAHDVVLTPYCEASQSGVVAQALARGRPVVATPVGALAEQLGDRAGWVADAATPEAYAAAMMRMLGNAEERVRKSDAAIGVARAAWRNSDWTWLGA